MRKRSLGPCITFFPQPATWIVSVANDGAINLMTASWVSLVSKTPPTVAVSLEKKRKTYANIAETGVFTVNVIPAQLAAEGDLCGLISGYQAEKLDLVELTPIASQLIAAPRIAESPLCLECRKSGEVEIGDYRLILGEILEVQISEAAGSPPDWQVEAIDPLVYLGGIREYRRLGATAGSAYAIGRGLLPGDERENS